MTGVSFCRAGHSRVGFAGSRASGGYTIHRPDHWSLEGTDLFYGNVLGAECALVGYQTDGCAFRLEAGLPVPTGEDGAPEGFEIVGVAPASLGEPETTPAPGLLGRADVEFIAGRVFDGEVDRAARGHATFGSFRRGGGEVFTAGTTEWARTRRGRPLRRPHHAQRAGPRRARPGRLRHFRRSAPASPCAATGTTARPT